MGGRMSIVIKAKINKLLDKAEDPGETLEYSYQRQMELLQNVKKGIADVVTSKKRLQLQQSKLEQQVVKLDTQARQALAANNEELARTALGPASGTGRPWQPADVRTLLAKFGLGAEHVARPARSLSMGERTRACMALFQGRAVNVLVLDEPTNHLDVDAIEQLEAAVAAFSGTVLVVSHDVGLLDGIRLTHRWHVDRGRVHVESL
jgi:ATPase subunit of ABC transporter with duplicated ATPase domains